MVPRVGELTLSSKAEPVKAGYRIGAGRSSERSGHLRAKKILGFSPVFNVAKCLVGSSLEEHGDGVVLPP